MACFKFAFIFKRIEQKMKISLSILFLLLLSAAILQAQEAVFITQPAAQKVGINDKFEVKFILKNISNAQRFSLSPMPDFEVIDGPSRSNNASIINGEVSQSLELTYVFKAKRKGKLVIPGGITSLSGGKQIRSNNVAIEIIDGSVANRRQQQIQQNDPFGDMFDDEEDPMLAMLKQQQQMMRQLQRQPQQNFPQSSPQQQPNLISRNDIDKNIFILAIPDKTSATLGEQITVSYKLYTRIPMDVRPTNRPSLIGFWSQDFNIPYPPQARREIYQGKEWNVLELKRTALFPTQTGMLELDPAEAEGNVKIPHVRRNTQQNTPGQTMEEMMDALMNDDPYEYETVPVKLKSQVVKINVTDIPIANKPATFNGAIGTYNIESNINKTELTTDDNATITLRVSGTGNLKMIGTPKINFPEDLDAFDPKIEDTITNTNDVIAGYKTFTYSFTPRTTGSIIIPSTEFSYFDPIIKEYKTLSTPSYTLHVKQGKEDKSTVHRLPKDIHDINTTSKNIVKKSSWNLISNPIYWGGFGVPLLAYFGLVFFKRKEDELQSNHVLFKNKRANKIALKRLTIAESYLKQTAQSAFYEETSKAVWLYLSDKLNIPISNLSKEVANKKLQEKNISSDLQIELFRVTNECEMALYAPDSGTLKMHQTYSDAFKLIGKLENELS